MANLNRILTIVINRWYNILYLNYDQSRYG